MTRKVLFIALLLGACVAGPEFTAATPELDTALADAVQYQDLPKIKELLGKGADVNYLENGRSLLGWAAQSDNLNVVRALIDAHAKLDIVDGVGHTPLIRAIDTQQTEIVKALIAARANVNAKDREGKTVLMKAVESRKPEIVQAVINGGADVKAVTSDGESPALIAAQDGMPESLEIIKILGAAKANMNASNPAYTPLSYAINQEKRELVQALLAAGADPNAKTATGGVPLAQAISTPEIFKLLLAAKADPNVANDRGETPLFSAIEDGTPEVVEELIKAGADVNKKSTNGNTPLMLAGNLYKQDVVELLKKHGATE